jgi:hypothetical protein
MDFLLFLEILFPFYVLLTELLLALFSDVESKSDLTSPKQIKNKKKKNVPIMDPNY